MHIERHLDAPGIPLSRTLIDGHIVKHGPNLNSLSNSESRKRFKASNTKVQSRTKKRPEFSRILRVFKVEVGVTKFLSSSSLAFQTEELHLADR